MTPRRAPRAAFTCLAGASVRPSNYKTDWVSSPARQAAYAVGKAVRGIWRGASAQPLEHALRLVLQRTIGTGHHLFEKIARTFHIADLAELLGQFELAR